MQASLIKTETFPGSLYTGQEEVTYRPRDRLARISEAEPLQRSVGRKGVLHLYACPALRNEGKESLKLCVDFQG